MMRVLSMKRGIDFSQSPVFSVRWNQVFMLNGGSHHDADGAGRGCLSLTQAHTVFSHGERVRADEGEDDLLQENGADSNRCYMMVKKNPAAVSLRTHITYGQSDIVEVMSPR